MAVTWQEIVDNAVWDKTLAGLHGHALQSALWGEARQKAEGLSDLRLAGTRNGEVQLLARIESRSVPLVGKFAWLPRGPTIARDADKTQLMSALHRELERRGYCGCISDFWQECAPNPAQNRPQTIWLDLTQDAARLWENCDSVFRKNLRRAESSGVVVLQESSPALVDMFYQQCITISKQKGFELPGNPELMRQLLASSWTDEVEARLFTANCNSDLAAGLLVIRCGSVIHNLWGGTDRAFSKQKPGEAVYWAVVQWGKQQGCVLYDLEGIDPVNNPGTYAFKKRLGGREVTLEGPVLQPYTIVARLAGWAGVLLKRFSKASST